jgi:predicted naringenin-chalcone synthase
VRLLNLSRDDGQTVLASVQLRSGEIVMVAFTTSTRDGITVANPDQDIFEREPLDAEDMRAIVAAVVAFARAAAHSHEAT